MGGKHGTRRAGAPDSYGKVDLEARPSGVAAPRPTHPTASNS